LERVLIDTQAGNVRAVEMFDADGFPMYRAVLDRIKQIDGYRIPFRVVLSNDEGTVFKLDIEKYWADIPVDPSVFVLKPPE
jgi:hypothetical protein